MKKTQTVTYRRALLIVALPGIGMWRQVRDDAYDDDVPFSRKPNVFEVVPLCIAAATLVAALIAGNTVIELLTGFAVVCFLIRPLGRVLMPAGLARTERELMALTSPRTFTHLIFVAFLVLMAIAGNWLALGIILAMGALAVLAGAYLVQLMLSGLVNRKGGHATR